MRIKYSIIIVNYKTLEHTRACLESVREYSLGCDYEVIIIDNDSRDKSLEYLRNQKDIHLIERIHGLQHGPWDHGQSLDIGIQMAKGEYLVILDSDVIILQRDWLETLSAILEKEQSVMIGPSFYGNFIHPCVLMVKRQIVEQVNLTFAPRTYFHHYFDTAQYATHILLTNNYRLTKLASWMGNSPGATLDVPIDGTDSHKWGQSLAPQVAGCGVYVSNLAYHMFYGSRAVNSDCDGSFNTVLGRSINYEEIKANGNNFLLQYQPLTDNRPKAAKIIHTFKFASSAGIWLSRRFAVKLRDKLLKPI